MSAISGKCWITRSAGTGGRPFSVDHADGRDWPFERVEAFD
jgi:hypothetical protein